MLYRFNDLFYRLNEIFVVLISIFSCFNFFSDKYREGNVPSGVPYCVVRRCVAD